MSHGNPQTTAEAIQPLQLHPSHYLFRLNCPHVPIHRICSWIIFCVELHNVFPQLTIIPCMWWVHHTCIMGATKPANKIIHEVQNREDVTGKKKFGKNAPLQWNSRCDSSWIESHSYQNILRESCFKAKWIQFINRPAILPCHITLSTPQHNDSLGIKGQIAK